MATNKVGSLVLVPKLMAWVEDVGQTPWLQLVMSNSVELHLFVGRKHVVSYTHTHTHTLSLSHRCAYKRVLSNGIYLYKEKSILKAHTIANLWLGQKNSSIYMKIIHTFTSRKGKNKREDYPIGSKRGRSVLGFCY